MGRQQNEFRRRIDSIRIRAQTLSSLRKAVGLPKESDLSEERWAFLEKHLVKAQKKLLSRLNDLSEKYLPNLHQQNVAGILNESLGKLELEMAQSFVFFDTYMDVLTQRHSPALEPLLRGCDILARDAMMRDHPVLQEIETPLVFCDRGFGAAILRADVRLPDGTLNPMPLIQIPYSRLKEKHNLTSILHEAGHQAMVRLGLINSLSKAFRLALSQAGAPQIVVDLYCSWASEIGPDFWGFCASGIAQVGTIKEILSLASDRVFQISWGDPHPPAYIRALLAFDWCRYLWGRGEWDNWQQEWLEFYPVEHASLETQNVIREAKRYIPIVSRTLFKTKFRILNGKKIPDLFDLESLAPEMQKTIAETVSSGTLQLKGLAPCTQLAVFRVIRDSGKFTEQDMDKSMSTWLARLGNKQI